MDAANHPAGVNPSNRTSGPLALVLLALVALVLAACGAGGSSPMPTSLECPADLRAAGTFPELEALVPRSLEGRAPTTVDSGANCTPKTLGTYLSHGIGELRYAGATWDEGGGDGTVIAVMGTRPAGQPALQAAWVEEFYESGARRSTKTENIEISRPDDVGGAGTVYRLDTLNDLSLQTVVVWPGRRPGEPVHVVIVATNVNPDASRAEHDRRVDAAVAAAVEAASGASQSGVPSLEPGVSPGCSCASPAPAG